MNNENIISSVSEALLQLDEMRIHEGLNIHSDLTKRVTLQNLYNDGGFSNVGVSQEIIDIVSSTNKG